MTSDSKRAHALLWVPSLYFAMGTPKREPGRIEGGVPAAATPSV